LSVAVGAARTTSEVAAGPKLDLDDFAEWGLRLTECTYNEDDAVGGSPFVHADKVKFHLV